jgi:outer membrane protein assembly factor BamA
VQFLDPEGNPIDPTRRDELGNFVRTGAPTINRFTFAAETRREFERTRNARGEFSRLSTLVLRYAYEDVRLYNTESLLIRSILDPDRTVRLSRLGASFARDTRDSQSDATRGQFITLDYSISLRQLGGNFSFNRLQANYRRYNRFGTFRGRPLVLAGSIGLGLANLFQVQDRNRNGVIDDGDRRLPISERFFIGGSTTLRGFDFEEAGPRVAVAGGILRNRDGELVTVDPFTVPVGGNALAVVNLEARVPITTNIQLVPFYDGGNVFESIRDIFGRERARDLRDPFAIFSGDAQFARNLDARVTNSFGLGLRIRTPFGPVAVDYSFLIRPPRFLVPQAPGFPPANDILPSSQIHIRFGQAF